MDSDAPGGRDRSRRHASGGLLASVVLLAVVGAACVGGDDFDRDAAIAQVNERFAGRLDAAQAGCYVDRAREEVGVSDFSSEAELEPQQIGRLTSIRVDCIGVENLAVLSGSTTTRPLDPEDTWLSQLPSSYGDDPQLDLLWDSCDAGVGSACDQLFDLSAPGSEYEDFALSCGGRTREPRCAEVYRVADRSSDVSVRSEPSGAPTTDPG